MYLAPGPPLEIREVSPTKGRGVFAVTPLKAKSVVHVSPILLFPTAEYEAQGNSGGCGCRTLLDCYTFRWPGGMALALGVGSIFNHSRNPNVGFIRDVKQGLIQYVMLRDVEASEELCISYGNRLWFNYEGSETGDEEEVDGTETAEEFLGRIQLGEEED